MLCTCVTCVLNDRTLSDTLELCADDTLLKTLVTSARLVTMVARCLFTYSQEKPLSRSPRTWVMINQCSSLQFVNHLGGPVSFFCSPACTHSVFCFLTCYEGHEALTPSSGLAILWNCESKQTVNLYKLYNLGVL